jgi:hypothetical protein
MDGACFPIPDMQIDVCRVTGAISVENVDAVLEDQKVIDSDHISATFWEPRGDIEYCSNPWDALSMNTCEVLSSSTDGDFFPSSAESGLPDERRSVGSWPPALGPGESATTETPDIRAGEQLDVQSSGDATDYMGPWQESRLAQVPGQFTWRNPEILKQSGGSSLSLSYAGASSDSRGALVFGNVADSGTGMMCRFSDTGTDTIPASTLSQLDGGWGVGWESTTWKTPTAWVPTACPSGSRSSLERVRPSIFHRAIRPRSKALLGGPFCFGYSGDL